LDCGDIEENLMKKLEDWSQKARKELDLE